jgi:hypothetical protein
MQAITTIGLDIAKSVFQVHGIDAEVPLCCSVPGAERLGLRENVGRPALLISNKNIDLRARVRALWL